MPRKRLHLQGHPESRHLPVHRTHPAGPLHRRHLPICGADGARGDQCDACGNELDPDELLNPVSKINGETPRFEETEHFFLDLPALAEANLAWLKTREGWRTNVINFSIGLFKEVKPRAITRDIDWGIPVPVKGWIDNPNKSCTCGSTL